MNNLTADYIGTKVLIRSADSGVHFGTLDAVDRDAVRLTDSRRLWAWRIANGSGISLTEVAIAGISHDGSRISMVIPSIVVSGVCEIIPAHGLCVATVESAPVAKPE